MLAALRGWTPAQRNTVIATYLAWSLDTYAFFVLVFVLGDIASQLHVTVTYVAVALTLTLAFRPVGAFIFGRLADHYGRKPILLLNIALYSLFGLATAFSTSLTVFFVIRALFGIAMGGIWGIGASLALESIKPNSRGFVSGLLQSGYPTGYLLASLTFGLLYAVIGWRGMFMLGIVPAALLIYFIHRTVPESPGWSHERAKTSTWAVLKDHWRLTVYAVILLTACNFLAHGTQDLYPTFLQKQHGFGHATVSTIAIVYNFGALVSGIIFGTLSQSFGRRRTMMAAALLSVPVAYLWAYSATAVMLGIGAFFMQVCVQAVWCVIPAHLNELSPAGARGTFPGTVYQLGNLIAAINAIIQAGFAESHGGNYSLALATVAILSALAIAILAKFSPEARDVEMRA